MKHSSKRRNVYRGPKQTGPQKPVVYRRGVKKQSTSRISLWLYILGGIFLLLVFVGVLFWIIHRKNGGGNSRTTDANGDITSVTVEPSLNPVTITPTGLSTPKSTEDESASAPLPGYSSPDFDHLRELMLQLINQERKNVYLDPVEVDLVAQKAGQEHADEMAELGYLSHWDIDGFGPDYRYSRVGGTDYVQENVASYSFRYNSGAPAPINDWDGVVAQIHANLMESEGHRANILDEAHTHLGIGIAYNPLSGEVRVAQEFVNSYSRSSRLPFWVRSGDRIVLRGTFSPEISESIAILTYEPFPEPMSLEQLKKTRTYASTAQKIEDLDMSISEENFVIEVILGASAMQGIYHVEVFSNLPSAGQIQIIDQIFEVR